MVECKNGCDIKGLGRFEPGDPIPVDKVTKKDLKWLAGKGCIDPADLPDEGVS